MAEAKRIKGSNGNVGNPNKIKASDDVIEKIISFLPIKRATEFSLLSKRFENSWRHCRVFSFGIDFARGRVREVIIPIVNRAFESHMGTKIQRFSLYFDPTDLEDLVNYWIRNAVAKGIEDLDLDFNEGKVAFKIDFAIIDVKSLRTLKLTNCIIDVPLELKGLRFLKSLFLHKVDIYVWVTLHLFSNCLLLESLKLVSCTVSQNLNVVAQNLKKFKVLIIDHCHSLSSINIDARTLCSLHYHGEFCNINLNSSFPQLDDVILDFTPAKGFQNVSQVKKLIMGLTYANVLTVTSTFLEVNLLFPEF